MVKVILRRKQLPAVFKVNFHKYNKKRINTGRFLEGADAMHGILWRLRHCLQKKGYWRGDTHRGKRGKSLKVENMNARVYQSQNVLKNPSIGRETTRWRMQYKDFNNDLTIA